MILEKVKKTIRQFGLIDPGEKILIGVSGGPDSVALLFLLKALSRELKITLHIAHLDHMLRQASYKDREFTQGLARKLKIPFTFEAVNVKSLNKKGSLEEAARKARFDFLFKTAKAVKGRKIALAHNLDDQAETVLMRVLRGSGLQGLGGILPKRKISGFQVIRPLIEVSRREIEGYLRKKKIRARLDESNLEEKYFRNKIRKRLLPYLEKEYNKNIRQALANLGNTSGEDYQYLKSVAEKKARKSKNKISLANLKKEHPALRRLMLRYAIEKLKKDTRSISFQHIKEIEDLISSRPEESIVDLPKGVSVKKKKTSLVFYRRRPPKKYLPSK